MRIALLVNRDIESNLALNLLLPQLAGHELSIFVSERVGGGAVSRLLEPLAFIEQDFFNHTFFPLRDAAGGSSAWRSFEGFAREGIPLRSVASARSESGLAALAAVQADLFICIRFGCILGEAAIALPRLGVLNLHSGLLPQYRGVLATFRALAAGDAEYGCTLHRIDTPGIDTGPIIATHRLPVRREHSLLWHILALYPPGVSLIAQAVAQLAGGVALPSQAQTDDGAYFSYPDDAELLAFLSQGWRLFERRDVAELLVRYASHAAPP
ncbi:methionyl-tRNA formyltransferase [Solimonas aquatica]|uniref:Methionyl-tRNA formyltransferase n=1 Tax=Solimonas aquatica TaxID=489703 RepID=A0A1H9FUY1_9GAMM|nr:formyl transferase [Solimonas aquatica]SEQ41687.1 methionyl-tRNA formyltransferase [Solimonas aquatica]